MGAPAVELRDVGVRFGDATALEGFSLTVDRGECLALLGPSGSGKSTALNAIAGFVQPTSGRVLLGGQDVTDLPPARRGLGFVVQSYALFPHMSVRDNIGFGLRVRRTPKAQIATRVREVADLVGMSAYLDRRPGQLSGGQQQRVALARALAIRPDVLLLDEPMSALDTRLREQMLDELARLRRDLPDVAMVMVTHDQGEAMALADRVALLRDGRCEAWDEVSTLFYTPPTPYTATFLGSAGILPARALTSADDELGAVGISLLGLRTQARCPRAVEAGSELRVAVRPWHWEVRRGRPTEDGWLDGRLESDRWKGSAHHCTVSLPGVGHGAGTSAATSVPVEIVDGVERASVGEQVHLRPRPGTPVVVEVLTAARHTVEARRTEVSS